MAILSTAQIIQYTINFLKAKNPLVDLQVGSDIYDLVLAGNAQTARRIFEDIERLQNNQSLSTTVSADLDLIARNYNVSRKTATYATGEVSFFNTNFDSNISIPLNTVVGTKGTNVTPSVRFKTTKTVGMIIANKSIYFDSTASRYQIKAPIIAEIPGSSGNIDQFLISETISAVSNISGVVNDFPTTGGTEQENDNSLQQRCLESFTVSSAGTVFGYKKLLQDNFNEIVDVLALGPFDSVAIRNTGVDIFTIISDADTILNEVQTTESFIYSTGSVGYVPLYRPILSVDLLQGTASGLIRTFIPYPNLNADFQFLKDYTGEKALSISSADRVEWMPLGILPDNGSKVFITYTYNKKIQDVQSFMNRDENKIVGADALVKTGFKARSYLKLAVKYFPNVDITGEQVKVQAALAQFLSELKFGESLQLSDLMIVAQTGKWTDQLIMGVDEVIFDIANCYIVLEGLGITRYMINDEISVNINEFIREGVTTIS